MLLPKLTRSSSRLARLLATGRSFGQTLADVGGNPLPFVKGVSLLAIQEDRLRARGNANGTLEPLSASRGRGARDFLEAGVWV